MYFADPMMGTVTGAQCLLRVRASRTFPDCPRNIRRQACIEPSPCVPRPGRKPPQPKWNHFDAFRDVLPGDGPRPDLPTQA